MTELVICRKDEPFTDSYTIASGGNVAHSSVLRLIGTHVDDLASFGRVGFEIRPLNTKGGVQNVKMCWLNEEQATFVISLMKNTKPVVSFKKELVRQFFQMRNQITDLLTARTEYPQLTEAIREAHKEPKPYHFSNELNMINKIVLGMTTKEFREAHGLKPKELTRPCMTQEQINGILALQRVDIGLIVSGMPYIERKQVLEEYYGRVRETKLLTA
jgi:phage regulator Rha-like protein